MYFNKKYHGGDIKNKKGSYIEERGAKEKEPQNKEMNGKHGKSFRPINNLYWSSTVNYTKRAQERQERMQIEQTGTITLVHPLILCKFVGNGDGKKPTESITVQAGTYKVVKIKNPIEPDLTSWIVLKKPRDKDGTLIGMAEEPLKRKKIEIVV